MISSFFNKKKRPGVVASGQDAGSQLRRENNSTSADGHDRFNGAGADSVESDALGVDVVGDRRAVAAGAVAGAAVLEGGSVRVSGGVVSSVRSRSSGGTQKGLDDR